MCLALPAKIVEREGDSCWVVLGDARMRVSLLMTPEAQVGDWVLVHAGFAITQVPEEEALETWEIVESAGVLEPPPSLEERPEEVSP